MNCSPASGSLFPVGTTAVTCSSADSRFNTANETFSVTVVLTSTPPPPPPPPADFSVEATGPGGAHVIFDVGMGDDFNGRPIGNCLPASGSLFPLGTTTVTCSNGSFRVTVVDTTPPALALPFPISATATSIAGGAEVSWTATAFDLVDGSVTVNCMPPSGSTFAIGVTTVNCSATDAHSNSASGSFEVTVYNPSDLNPPDIHSITASPDTLWSPNGDFRDVTITVNATDDQSTALVSRIYDVGSPGTELEFAL